MTAVDDRPALLGKAEPRLWTRSLRPLTPATTLGFEAIRFAENVLGLDLLEWQRWWLLHALELRQDGTFRFRTIVTLVGRQQGKTFLLKIVALWAMYLDRVHLVLGAAQSLDIARESWKGALDLARGNELLANELTRVTTGSIETAMTLTNGARYRITAATPGSGRGLSVDLLILDELREQRDWEAWSALSKTTIARPNALTVAISNAGDDKSVVLNSLRGTGLAETDESIALFEWSAPDGCALDDPDAWCQAMPGLGHGTITESAVRLALATDPESVFRCLDTATPVLTSAGWSNMGALNVGDQVKGVSGKWANIVNVSPTHFKKDCYRVTLNDRRSIVCDAEHLWTVKDRRRRVGFETVRTVDLIERGVTYHNPSMNYDVRNFSLPPVQPLDGPDVDLPIHPYLLGLWLGDGAEHAALIFTEQRDAAHIRTMIESTGATVIRETQDSENCVRLSFQVDGRVGGFTGALHDLGIYRNKLIPDAYFTGSFAQRLALVQGLMDSDGTIFHRTGRASFANTNDKLVVGMRTLVRSLGWKTSDLEPGRYGEAHHKPRYDVCWTPRPGEGDPCTLPRKLAHVRQGKGARGVRPVTIVSIEPVPTTPVRCIEVDTPDSLFLAGDLVPTHNTELLCQSVDALNPALDPHGWAACADRGLDIAPIAQRAVMCLDVSPDGEHVSMVTAALRDDGKVAIVESGGWSDTTSARRALAEMLPTIRPRALGWYPSGPAAVLGAELAELNADKRGPIGRMTVDRKSFREWAPGLVELRGDAVKEACQTLADLVKARRLVHAGTALLNSHATGAQRLDQGDGWRFTRRGAGHVDAMYAAAGAVHLVRTIPAYAPPPKSAVW
jgi:hypothetical protein